jgi:hypothetical protein
MLRSRHLDREPVGCISTTWTSEIGVKAELRLRLLTAED